jgi:predicted DsbA family dithiol-disulfide isomerase
VTGTSLFVEIWSDVVCPWCYIGKRRFETALRRFEHRDAVAVRWRSFELDPGAPRERTGDPVEHLARKYGVSRARAAGMYDRVGAVAASEGLEYHLDRARRGNTFDAHRLLHLAAAHGVQSALKERLLAAYFTEGEPIGEPAVLARLAADVGLDARAVDAALAGDDHAADVRRDERLATGLGVTGVPFFVMGRKAAVAGAQSPEVLLEALEHAWAEQGPPGSGERTGDE